ncbi:Serine/threonine-protein kinase [Dirofilaria immitis]
MISDNSISRSATQLALQLMIEFIIILRPTQACLSGGGCCPPTSQLIQKSSSQQCQSTSSSCSGGYPSYAPQTPFGIGASGSYYQPPMAFVSSGGPPPSYGSGGLHQNPQNIPQNIAAPYSSVGIGVNSGSFYPDGNKETNIGFGGDGEIVNLTPPPINVPPQPPSQQSLEDQSGYDQKMIETEMMKLTPHATEMSLSKPDSIPELYKQSESVDDAYAKIVADHEVGQQQKQQQSYAEISTAEKSHAKTDIIDYGGGAIPVVNETQSQQVKFEQPGPETSYGGGAVPAVNEAQSQQVKFEQPGPETAYGGGAVSAIGGTQHESEAVYGGGAVSAISGTQHGSEAAYGDGAVPAAIRVQPGPEAAYGGGAVSAISEVQPGPEVSYGGEAVRAKSEVQPGPEAAYSGEVVTTKSNIAYQGDTSTKKSDIGIASATSESLKTEISYDGQEGNVVIESRNIEMDDSACNDPMLKVIIESTLNEHRDNLDAARSIESKASKHFGGRFNSIVSDSEFAYVNWYGKRNCQLQINGRHSLTWED